MGNAIASGTAERAGAEPRRGQRVGNARPRDCRRRLVRVLVTSRAAPSLPRRRDSMLHEAGRTRQVRRPPTCVNRSPSSAPGSPPRNPARPSINHAGAARRAVSTAPAHFRGGLSAGHAQIASRSRPREVSLSSRTSRPPLRAGAARALHDPLSLFRESRPLERCARHSGAVRAPRERDADAAKA